MSISKFRDPNPYEIQGDIAIIYTKDSNGVINGHFIIDREDLDKIRVYKWFITDNGKGYQRFQGHLPNHFRDLVSIPRVIFGQPAPPGWYYDHKDRDNSNNRRSNLRLATPRENGRNLSISSKNTSGYVGVGQYTRRNGQLKWRAYINYDHPIMIGDFDTLEDACWARYLAEVLVYQNFRNLENAQRLYQTGMKSLNRSQIYGLVAERLCKKILPKLEESGIPLREIKEG